MHRRYESSGFAAIETVLIIAIVLVIGAVGAYVFHTRHPAAKTTALTTSSSKTPTTTTSSTNTTTAPTGSTSDANLNSGLAGVNSSSNQESADQNGANTALNDQSSEITVPTN